MSAMTWAGVQRWGPLRAGLLMAIMILCVCRNVRVASNCWVPLHGMRC